MDYGYARTSKPKQNIQRQIRNIGSAYPEAVILQEAYTGTTLNRREWAKLMKAIKPGDRIIFDSVSRMSRNAEDGFAEYERLFHMGIELVFLKEPHINTETYRKTLENSIQMTGSSVDLILEGVNKYLMVLAKEQIRLAFIQSEKEVEDMRQRTREGLQTAKLNGKRIGIEKGRKLVTKKSVASKATILKHARDFGGSLSDKEVMALTGLARATYYKYKRELKGENDGQNL